MILALKHHLGHPQKLNVAANVGGTEVEVVVKVPRRARKEPVEEPTMQKRSRGRPSHAGGKIPKFCGLSSSESEPDKFFGGKEVQVLRFQVVAQWVKLGKYKSRIAALEEGFVELQARVAALEEAVDSLL